MNPPFLGTYSAVPLPPTPMLRLASAVALVVTLALPAQAQRANDEPRVSANAAVGQTVGTTELHVEYGRPSVRGRAVFGHDGDALVPYGQVWRTGANEATTVELSGDVLVEGDTLEAGTYSLFTIPTEGAWTVVFNRVAEQWGAFRYDAAQDALRVQVTPETEPEEAPQEQFEIRFEDVTATEATMLLEWDRLRVPVRFQMVGAGGASGG